MQAAGAFRLRGTALVARPPPLTRLRAMKRQPARQHPIAPRAADFSDFAVWAAAKFFGVGAFALTVCFLQPIFPALQKACTAWLTPGQLGELEAQEAAAQPLLPWQSSAWGAGEQRLEDMSDEELASYGSKINAWLEMLRAEERRREQTPGQAGETAPLQAAPPAADLSQEDG